MSQHRKAISNTFAAIVVVTVVLLATLAALSVIAAQNVASPPPTPSVSVSTQSSGTTTSSTTHSTTTSSSVMTTPTVSSSTTSTSSASTTVLTSSSSLSTSSSSTTSSSSSSTQSSYLLAGSSFALDGAQHELFVINSTRGNVVEIDDRTNVILNDSFYPSNATNIMFDEANSALYVSSNGVVKAVDTRTGHVSFTFSGFTGLAFVNGNSLYFYTYICCTGSFNFSLVEANSHQVVENITLFGNMGCCNVPGPMLFDPLNGLGYVTIESVGVDGGGHNWTVYMLDTTANKVVGSTIDLGLAGLNQSPNMVTYNANTGDFYASQGADYEPMGIYSGVNSAGDNISVIQGITQTGVFQLSTSPDCTASQYPNNNSYYDDTCVGVAQSTLGSIGYNINDGMIYIINGTVYPRGYYQNGSNPPSPPPNDILVVSAATGKIASVLRENFNPVNLYVDETNGNLYVVGDNGRMYVFSTNDRLLPVQSSTLNSLEMLLLVLICSSAAMLSQVFLRGKGTKEAGLRKPLTSSLDRS